MKLTENFTLEEMTRSDTAARLGIANTPSEAEIKSLKLLCENILEPLREHFGAPVNVRSGYRCLKLNHHIGGAEKSQHVSGQAADIEINGIANDVVWQYIVDNLPFDQVIAEHLKENSPSAGWVHVSYAPAQRKSALSCVHGEYPEGLHYEA